MGQGAREKVIAWLGDRDGVSAEDFDALLVATGVSKAHLRRLLRQMPLRLAAEVEGVRQENPEALARTLMAMSELYATKPNLARSLVQESKEHAKLALRRGAKDEWRQQVLLHLYTWLENPAVYPLWCRLEKSKAATQGGGSQEQ